jgi:tRNA (cytidine/uridine-2'-O-)-methyltransferase
VPSGRDRGQKGSDAVEIGGVTLPPHRISLALVHPQIAPNTGNIARLCVATGTALHLVRPLGFLLTDKQLKRSAMDYWPRLKLTVHDDLAAFTQAMAGTRLWLCENDRGRSMWDAKLEDGDTLVLGSEGPGLPTSLLDQYPEQTISIPQAAGERCLNVATAAGIVLFEALRRVAGSIERGR